jgi:hypothetical protein
MKKFLLFAALLFSSAAANAQAIANGGFESWNASSTDMLNYYPQTSNPQALSMNLPANALKVADPQQGALALQLNTVANATDTMFGFITNGDPTTGQGGIPYAQHPITLTGYYKSNVMPGDTALLLIMFKEAGIVLSLDGMAFTGVHNTYTSFSVALTIPAISNPDSIVFAAVSSNAFVNNGIPGSMLQLDNLTFTGVASQPALMNGSFESWTTVNTSRPIQWSVAGDIAYQTPDAHSGNYAIMLNTFPAAPGFPSPSYLTNGFFPPNQGPVGGRPYSLTNDTLCFWYKFIPAGTDSATVALQTSAMGNPVGGAGMALPPASAYTFYQLPFSSFSAPDTLLIVFASSYNDVNMSNIGSVLKIDDVYLKSSLLAVPEISWNTFGKVTLYPNPSETDAYISFDNNSENEVTMTISDVTGKTISEIIISGSGHHNEHLDVSTMSKGNYTVTLSRDGKRVSRKLIVE